MNILAAHQLTSYFSGSVGDKLTAAEQLFTRHGGQLLADTSITTSLFRLRQASTRLGEQMTSMAMGQRCCRCAATTGGGCCSACMADNSDAILLLINRLMGIQISQQEDNDRECCLLGKAGCTLLIKPIFCLNYNCLHIHKAAGKGEMKVLEQFAGVLLQEQTRLETDLLALIA